MLKLSIAWLVLPIMYVIWGLVLIIHPPKRNEYVGYRSQRSKQSTDHWAYAQKLWPLVMCFWFTIKWCCRHFTVFLLN